MSSLTIVIPTFGRVEPLRELLATIARQTVAAEVIVVDQNAAGLIDAIVPDSAMHLRLAEPNAAAARNAGFLASTTSHVLFVDDDELLEPTHVERVLHLLRTHPNVRCLWPIVHSGDRDRALRSWRGQATGETIAGSSLFRIARAGAGGIVFERELFRELGGYDDLLFRYGGMSEDWELSHRMKQSGAAIWCDPELFVRHQAELQGGCATRTLPYGIARTRIMAATMFRLRIANAPSFHLGMRDIVPIIRFCLLSSLGRPDARRQVLAHPVLHLRMLASALFQSHAFAMQHRERYVPGAGHLQSAVILSRIDGEGPHALRAAGGPSASTRLRMTGTSPQRVQ